MGRVARQVGWIRIFLTLLLSLVMLGLSNTGSAAEVSQAKTKRIPQSNEADKRDSVREMHIEKKLDQILANQATILEKFDLIMEELRIIKVRASIRSGS